MLIARANKVKNSVDDHMKIDRRKYAIATKHPMFRKHLRTISVEEDDENSFYSGMLDTLAEHCVGSVPIMQGNHEDGKVNNDVEDQWLAWAIANKIGSTIRQIRRAAARTGIGIGIPYQTKRTETNPVGFNIRTVSALRLTSPFVTDPKIRISEGIQYDENGDIEKVFISEPGKSEPTAYDAKDIIIWFKETREDMPIGLPECGPAFCLFPSIKRILNSIVKSQEFRTSIPMVMTLDKDVYTKEDAVTGEISKYEYDPGFVPTLPPGAELKGIDLGTGTQDGDKFLYMLISAAARCIQMPRNLALGDSGNSNMATAAYDIQPWKNKIKIDRTDFQPVVRQVIGMWMERAILINDYLPVKARIKFMYELNYDITFEHPDPLKRANARAVDLASGSTSLTEVYNDKGKTARRQLDKEALTLGLTREQLNQVIIASRVNAPFLLDDEEEKGIAKNEDKQ